MNLDSTQDIMQNTVVGDGKWTLTLEDGTMVAQAEVPPDTKITAELIEDWCTAVRQNVETLTIQRSKNRGSKQSSPGTTSVDDSSVSAGTVDPPASGDHALRAFTEDPESVARQQAEYYRQRSHDLVEELKAVNRLSDKWDRILKAIEDDKEHEQ